MLASALLAMLSIGGGGSANAAPFVLVSNTESGTVSVIDGATKTAVTAVPIAAGLVGPIAVAPDGSFAYVAHRSDQGIAVIDTAAGVVTATIPFGGFLRDIAFTHDGATAYVADLALNLVWVIDTASRTVIGDPISVSHPESIALAPDDSLLYVLNNWYYAGGTISIIDTSTKAVIDTIQPGGGCQSAIALSANGALAYVANACGGSLSVVSLSSRTLIANIPTNQSGSQFVAITRDGRLAYVSNTGSNSVSIIDLSTYRLVGSPITVGEAPGDLVVTPDDAFVYVTNQVGSVSVIEAATKAVVETIPVGDHPYPLAVAPSFTVVPAPECADRVDNDGDGRADWRYPQSYGGDLGCDSPTDESERSAAFVCDDGVDNDGDGAADYPDDPNCVSPTDPSENPVACDDGFDNDSDGLVDYPADPGCTDQNDDLELGGAACDNGLDDDGDGLTDYPADPGCPNASGNHESCDIDASGVIDRDDVQAIVDGIGEAVAAGDSRDADNDESITIFDSAACANQCDYEECAPPPPPCGLLGIEPVLVMAALYGMRSLRSCRVAKRYLEW